MKKNKLPSPHDYTNASDYFKDFMSINKNINANFSFRFIGNKLKWPSGYIPDVIAHRKVFTLTRAVQFADHYKMREVDKERMTWFALVESENEDVKAFFQKKLTIMAKDLHNPSITLNDPDLYNTIASIVDFLILKKRRMTTSEILKELRLSYLTEEKVKRALSEIEKNKYLVWDSNGKLIETNASFTFDDKDEETYSNLKLHREPTLNFLNFIESPCAPAIYNTGVLQIRKGQFDLVAKQILLLRNWLVEVSEDNIRTATENDQHRLMQYDLNLFSITDLH